MEKQVNKFRKFQIEITETTSRIIEINAKSSDEAWKKVSEMYHKGKIVLDDNDYVDTQIRII